MSEPDAVERVYDGRLVHVDLEHWGDNDREVVKHPGAVAIVAVDGEGKVALVRQRREAVRGYLLELPAGTLEEETGLTGGTWRELGAFYTTPGFCRERMHVFVAEGVEAGDAKPEEDEELELVQWDVGEIAGRIGELDDAKTIAGLLLYLAQKVG